MRCRIAHNLIARKYSQALTSEERERLAQHLQGCPECQKEARSLQSVTTQLRAAQSPMALSAGLTDRVMAAVAATTPVSASSRRARHARLLAGMTGVAAIGLFLLPTSRSPQTMSAAAVRHALTKVNTWHLKGWKLENSQRIPWEIWGRRKPFFYREQIGADLVVDNGSTRVSLFAPYIQEAYRRPQGVALRMPSTPDRDNVRWSYKRMTEEWDRQDWTRARSPRGPIFNYMWVQGTPSGPQIEHDHLFAVDKRNGLPFQYEIQQGFFQRDTPRQTLAHLDMEYDVPLPEAVSELPSAPPGYQVMDVLTPSNPPESQTPLLTQKGLTLQLTPLAVDIEGNVLVEARGWLGQTLLGAHSPIELSLSLFEQGRNGANARYVEHMNAYHDNRKRPYMETNWWTLNSAKADADSHLLLFTPITPLRPGDPPPAALTLALDARLTLPSRLQQTMDFNDAGIFRQDIAATLSLPEAGEPIERAAERYFIPNWRNRPSSLWDDESLETQKAEIRASYFTYAFPLGSPQAKALLPRALAWHERAIACAQTDLVQFYRQQLAELYLNLGNRKRAKELLQDICNEKRFSQLPLGFGPPTTQSGQEQRRVVEANVRKRREAERQKAEETLRQLEAMRLSP